MPGLAAPPPLAAASMALAGVCWGTYSLRGRRSGNPLAETSAHFVRTVPLLLAVSAMTVAQFHVEPAGVLLAVASGALATGLGYVVWYSALRGLTAMHASVLQLAVPVLAGAAGVLFLAEAVSLRLVCSAVLVLGGIALTIVSRARLARGRPTSPVS
jgi:drug/metabolite transporter (DMT)-like permease